MDHLVGQDRKDRWYAKNVRPLYVPVVPASKWKDLVVDDADSDNPTTYDRVRSVPFEWFAGDNNTEPSLTSVSREEISNCLVSALDEHGFLVISGVLDDATDCRHALDLAWDWIEAASFAEARCRPAHDTLIRQQQQQQAPPPAVNRDDPSSSSLLSSPFFPRAAEGGIQPFYGSGHSSFAWWIRSHPNVRTVFRSVHNSSAKDLIASLDGIVLWRVTSREGAHNDHDNDRHRTDEGWFHLDQNPKHKPQQCKGVYQGLVNLLPVTPSTGGNALVARSHRLFPQHYLSTQQQQSQQKQETGDNENSSAAAAVSYFYRQRLDEVGDDDWLEIDPNDTAVLEPSNIISLLLQPGDVLLWDSRVAHCSYPGQHHQEEETTVSTRSISDKDEATTTTGLIRAAALVTMAAKDDKVSVSRDVLLARKQAVSEGRTLSHWVDKASPLGEERSEEAAMEQRRIEGMKQWQDREGRKVLLEWEDLSESQRRLVVGNALEEV